MEALGAIRPFGREEEPALWRTQVLLLRPRRERRRRRRGGAGDGRAERGGACPPELCLGSRLRGPRVRGRGGAYRGRRGAQRAGEVEGGSAGAPPTGDAGRVPRRTRRPRSTARGPWGGAGGAGGVDVLLVRGRDEACPVSTRGGTRLVLLVREERGGGVRGTLTIWRVKRTACCSTARGA